MEARKMLKKSFLCDCCSHHLDLLYIDGMLYISHEVQARSFLNRLKEAFRVFKKTGKACYEEIALQESDLEEFVKTVKIIALKARLDANKKQLMQRIAKDGKKDGKEAKRTETGN